MLAQLLINYGDSTIAIPYAYIIYVAGSFILPWGLIKTVKYTRRSWRSWRESVATLRAEHQSLQEKQDKEHDRERNQQLRKDLPGRWFKIYRSIEETTKYSLRMHTLRLLAEEFPAKDNPLTPKGGAHLVSLMGCFGDERVMGNYLSKHVAEFIKQQTEETVDVMV